MGHTITLHVTDATNHTGQASLSVLITSPNQPPLKPTITGPQSRTIGDVNTYTVQTTDPNADAIYIALMLWTVKKANHQNGSALSPQGSPSFLITRDRHQKSI